MKKVIISAALTTALFGMSSAYAGGGSSIFSDTSGGGATTAGLYGGASIGKTYNDKCWSGDVAEDEEEGCQQATDDTAWKAFAGYKVMPNFAIEGAYIDFGSATKEVEGDYEADISLKGVSLMGVASTSITDDIDVFGKFGVMRFKADTWAEDEDISVSGTELAIGAGASMNVSDNIAIRGEVEHFDDLDINLYSAGVSYSTM